MLGFLCVLWSMFCLCGIVCGVLVMFCGVVCVAGSLRCVSGLGGLVVWWVGFVGEVFWFCRSG